ncbi:ComEC family competence protein [[Pseudomonas] carboxydohydrogena]|uniref:ComEC family competence protein n=1 Tax=Afipia carboxydohydrogena TaxID=290 RepID=A0ABY8BVX9_AFICR|nr:ComEC/Rec2 family competence protein [[Pseudomonas] carboxydohydrogena]WEF53076.1 ComEC family competence protein [[Pseudomonas] carboxydohydrogena]
MADGGLKQERPRAGRAIAWPPRERAASAISGSGWWQFLTELNLRWIRAETGPGRLLPWIPVAFGVGIALYFTAAREPVAVVVVPVAGLACLLALAVRRRPVFPYIALFAALLAGFATATLKTAWVSHTVLLTPVGSAALEGFVETHEERERTDRFVLRVTKMEAHRAPHLQRVRLSVRKGTAPAVGSYVTLKARLLPPLRPLRPGGYDFARDMYFQGIGASGFALGAIKVQDAPEQRGWRLRYAAWMQELRDAVDARIRTVLSGDQRAIATALLTGRRDAISSSNNDALFVSGLGHVLSISGYHMAVVAGVVFFAIRALLALNPALSARYAIKKWAALAALIAALFYLLLSGAEVATQRSFYMTALVLVAVMADRRAITFRTLALAAMLVLLIAPESLVHPSFQMSFAATFGLVVLAQIGMPQWFVASDDTRLGRFAAWGGRELLVLALASFVAGLATTPYAAFHFHRIAPYGVIANLVAMPVVSALVMPAGLLGIMAIPFGFDSLFWRLMEVGIDWMIAVSQWVAALPGAFGRVHAFGIGPLIVMSCGIVILGLLRSPLRWMGAALIGCGVAWAAVVTEPDILIARDALSVAVRGKDGRLRIMHTAKNAFVWREWLAADADGRMVTDPSIAQGVSCDEAGCVAEGKEGDLVALTRQPEALADDCAQAKVVVTPYPAPADCAARVFHRDDLRGLGGVALKRTARGYSLVTSQSVEVDRPWSPAIPEASRGSQSNKTLGHRTSPQPVDATPPEGEQEVAD